MLVSGTFQVILAFISLYNLLGWSAFVGVGIMVCLTVLSLTIADRQVPDPIDTVEHVRR